MLKSWKWVIPGRADEGERGGIGEAITAEDTEETWRKPRGRAGTGVPGNATGGSLEKRSLAQLRMVTCVISCIRVKQKIKRPFVFGNWIILESLETTPWGVKVRTQCKLLKPTKEVGGSFH